MSVASRISKLVTANVHEAIDGLENPEVMLQQTVRDMEDALRLAMDNAAQVIAHVKLLNRQLAEQEQWQATCHKQAVAALAKGDEAVARQCLARRSDHQRISNTLSNERKCTEDTANILRQQIESMRIRLSEARGRLLTLQARHRAAASRRQLFRQMSSAAQTSSGFSDFDRWAAKIEYEEAKSEALVELFQSTGSWYCDPCSDGNETVDAELAALKRKLASGE